jgi:hypothetical protein
MPEVLILIQKKTSDGVTLPKLSLLYAGIKVKISMHKKYLNG